MMNFYCIGISHKNAPLIIRETYQYSPEEQAAALSHYAEHAHQYLGVQSEVVILSTCNRLEVYAAADGSVLPNGEQTGKAFPGLMQFLRNTKNFTNEAQEQPFYQYAGREAVQHLFYVAAGLDSMVPGEPQILGQVTDAFEQAQQAGTARHTLSALFRAAIHTGKRARTETAIGENPASVSSIAVNFAERVVGPMNGHNILVIGAGEMSNLAVKAFRLRGAHNITIVNRTYDRAKDLAKLYEGKAKAFDLLPEALGEADIVISSTGAQSPVLTTPLIRQVMHQREERPLVLLDIAVPRDVEPEVRELNKVHLFDLDDLQQHLAKSMDHRLSEAGHVEEIVQQELAGFLHWMEVIPLVGKLHRKAEHIRQQEMERMLNHMPDLDLQLLQQVELLSRSLVKKILHEPTMKLRTEANSGQLEDYMNTMSFLFGLDDDDQEYNPSFGA